MTPAKVDNGSTSFFFLSLMEKYFSQVLIHPPNTNYYGMPVMGRFANICSSGTERPQNGYANRPGRRPFSDTGGQLFSTTPVTSVFFV